MGMFDAKMFGVSPLDMSGLKTSPMTPTIAAATSPRRRRGLPNMLGGLGDMLGGAVRGTVQAWTPSDGTRDPTVWDYVWGGQEHVDDVRNAQLQRMRMMSAQTQMDREGEEYKQNVQQRAARDAFIAQQPDNVRQMLQAFPDQAGSLLSRQMSQDTPLTDEQRRQYGLRDGTSAVMRDGHVQVLQSPREPPATIQLPGNAMGAMVDQMVANGGQIPPGMSRNPRMVAQLYSAYADRMAEQGLTAQSQQARHASIRANQTSLSDVRRRRGVVAPAERAMLDAASQVLQYSDRVSRSNSPAMNIPINRWNDQMRGDPNLSALRTAAISAATEYARLLVGSGATTDSARAEASHIFNENMTPAQLIESMRVVRADGAYRTQELQAEEQSILNDMQSGTMSASPEASQMPMINQRLGGDQHNTAPQGRVRRFNPATGRIE